MPIGKISNFYREKIQIEKEFGELRKFCQEGETFIGKQEEIYGRNHRQVLKKTSQLLVYQGLIEVRGMINPPTILFPRKNPFKSIVHYEPFTENLKTIEKLKGLKKEISKEF